jgi:hypothetical protein
VTLTQAIQALSQSAKARKLSGKRLADAVEELAIEILDHATVGDAVTVAGETYHIVRYRSNVGSCTFLRVEGHDEEEGGIIGAHMGAYLHGDFHCPLEYAGLKEKRHFALHAAEIVTAFATLGRKEDAANLKEAKASLA